MKKIIQTLFKSNKSKTTESDLGYSAKDLKLELALVHLKQGVVKDNQGDKMGAMEELNKAIELDPKLAKAYSNRGIIKCVLEDHRGAIKDINTAIKLDSKIAEAYYTRALANHVLGNNDEVLEDLSKAGEFGYAPAYDAIKKIQGR